MRRLLVLAALAALATFAAAAPAAAKGTLDRLDRPDPASTTRCRSRARVRRGTGTPLGSLVQLGGFFPQVFRETPDPTTRRAADCGSRPALPGGVSRSRAERDRHDRPGRLPVRKAQPGDIRARRPALLDRQSHVRRLVRLDCRVEDDPCRRRDCPSQPPSSGGASFPWAWTGAGAALALVLLTLLALRRRGITRLPALRSTA